MALKDLKKTGGSQQQKQEPGYGAVLEVKKATKTADGGVEVTGVIKTTSAFGKAGDKVTLVGDDKALTNLENGGAKFSKPTAAAGTVLLLERARSKGLGEGGDRTISAEYLTTISSPSKNYDMERGFRATMASAPVISFPNVNPGPNEPKTISWATNTAGITRRVKEDNEWKTKTFDRDWLKGKYEDALAAGKKAKVYMDTFDPANALPATTAGDVADTIKALAMRSKNSVVLLRAFDDESANMFNRKIPVRASKIGDEWVPDPDKTIEYFAENGYFKGVSNEALFADIAQGGSAMEVIPGERLFYPGDSANSVIKKSLINPPKNAEGGAHNVMSFTFGDRANNVAKVVIAGILPPDGGFVPLNMVREEPGVVSWREMITPNRQAVVAADPQQTLAHDDMVHDDDDMSLADGMDDLEFGVNMPSEAQQKSSAPAPGM